MISYWITILWVVVGLVLVDGARGGSFFESKRVWSQEKGIRGALLNKGGVVFFFEETRPATEEEKTKRAEEFERQWKELEMKKGDFEKKVESATEEMKKVEAEARQKKPFLPRFSIFAILSAFIKETLKSGIEIAYSLGKHHFVNAPVVTRAGFMFVSKEGLMKEILVDLVEEYGPETWQRMPNDAVYIRVSPDDRFVGLETMKGGIVLYELSSEAPSFIARVEGTHPFGFSPDGNMFVTLERGSYRIYRLPPNRDKDYRLVLPEFLLIKEISFNIPKGIAITDVLLIDRYLLILTWTELIVCDWESDKTHKFKLGGYGGRSLVATPDQEVFVAKMDFTLAKIDLKEMRIHDFKMNPFDLEKNHRVKFHKLVSISPDKRFIAAIYDPGLIPPKGAKSWSGSSTEESRLFIWDLYERKIAWHLEERLETIAGGFGYHPPAALSQDWKYLLLNLKGGGMELWELRGRIGE